MLDLGNATPMALADSRSLLREVKKLLGNAIKYAGETAEITLSVKQSGGYGLGLAIVKESMEVMKGKVKAENRELGGLRITLSFPIAG